LFHLDNFILNLISLIIR